MNTNSTHFYQKIEEEGTLTNSFYEVSVTLTLKPDKDNTKEENYRPITRKDIDAKIFNKISGKRIEQYIKGFASYL